MVKELTYAVELLIEYWQRQEIAIVREDCLFNNIIIKYNDFKYLYYRVDGMKKLYPNYGDKNGFLFYPLINVEPYEKMNSESKHEHNTLFVFADCMQGCWIYAIRIINEYDYEIVLIKPDGKWNKICNKLIDFIYLYLNDSHILYN